jgi:nucleoside-diphosphate-sugar epimerase
MKEEKIIYITGATGRLGKQVLRRIDATPLVRKESNLENEIVTDFSPRQLKGILNDADVVIHLAGSVDTLDETAMREANMELTRRIVDAAPKACKIIFAGSISVYGKKMAQVPANEDTLAAPDTTYARTKYDAERIVASHQNHVILRIATIYGPGFEDYFRILSMIERGKMRIIGDGNNRIPFVHVDDAADAVSAAVEEGSGTYVVSGEPLTQKEIYTIAAKALGVAAPQAKVGAGTANLLASIQELAYHVGGRKQKPPMTKEHINILSSDRAFDCSKAKKELGFSPRPLEEGIRETVAEYRLARLHGA